MNKVMSTIQDDSRKELISMRRNAGLTQSELARRLIPECTQATVSRWENGSSTIPFIHYISFCIACGVDVSNYYKSSALQQDNKCKSITKTRAV